MTRLMRGLDLLLEERYRHLFGGFLAVVDLANDPIATYEHLASFRPARYRFPTAARHLGSSPTRQGCVRRRRGYCRQQLRPVAQHGI